VHLLLGAAMVTAILVGGSLARYGVAAYEEAIPRLALHGSPESFSSRRIGLGHVLLYRGEWSRPEIDAIGGIDAKRAQMWTLYPYLKVMGVALLLLVAWYVWRSKKPVHRHVWMAIFPLFCLTNPQANYYNLRLLLMLYHTEEWHPKRDRVGLTLLFLVEFFTQATHVAGAYYYAVTAVSSIGMFVYLVTMAAMLASERDVPSEQSTAPVPASA
jgi:hypothetical protein